MTCAHAWNTALYGCLAVRSTNTAVFSPRAVAQKTVLDLSADQRGIRRTIILGALYSLYNQNQDAKCAPSREEYVSARIRLLSRYPCVLWGLPLCVACYAPWFLPLPDLLVRKSHIYCLNEVSRLSWSLSCVSGWAVCDKHYASGDLL